MQTLLFGCIPFLNHFKIFQVLHVSHAKKTSSTNQPVYGVLLTNTHTHKHTHRHTHTNTHTHTRQVICWELNPSNPNQTKSQSLSRSTKVNCDNHEESLHHDPLPEIVEIIQKCIILHPQDQIAAMQKRK